MQLTDRPGRFVVKAPTTVEEVSVALIVRRWRGCALLICGAISWVSLACAAPNPGAEGTPSALRTYTDWSAACRQLPSNRALGQRLPARERLPVRSYAEFAAALDPFLELCRTGAMAQVEKWVDSMPSAASFFNLEAGYYLDPRIPFQPFAQREVVPPGTRLFFHGDLHGDIHSLMAFLDELNREGHLEGFRITQPEVRIVFLGDYTDRGRYGVEVLYTLLRLKLANPEQVLLVRGNHEDVNLVARYGFLAEVAGKYGRQFDLQRVVRLYDFLPAVLYIRCGTNVIQCNHGGIEPGYDPARLVAGAPEAAYQLLGRLEQRRFLARHARTFAGLPPKIRKELDTHLMDFVPQTPSAPTVLGFLWNDFTVVRGEPEFAVDPGRAFVYGEGITGLMLSPGDDRGYRLRALFRGHQHAAVLNPMMRRLIACRGVFRHWQSADHPGLLEAQPEVLRDRLESGLERALPDGSVWTFNVAPDSIYGAGCGFSFATAGEVVTAERWDDWRIRIHNIGMGD
jgi:hypothetical protein